ncbi:NifB/NifX family molybdenum-iron cluster-binding protein [Flammeovirgaceae bacterium SG7u.111]|nr:NifB/NifX family molybdenum-iron cluster-binding protein [Flammeovirgaceae bacterium SG7u.132]WPO37579.1 NifB/NifX family molybdenum-iron cluster-binding protein [Flammeovirgaceae bacterium SG7u.111]
MKVAICTSDGSNVDLHFGKTKVFYIFEFSKGKKKLVEKRKVDSYCTTAKSPAGLSQHPFRKEKLDAVYDVIKDCKQLVTASIGETPKGKLEEKGMAVTICICPISRV